MQVGDLVKVNTKHYGTKIGMVAKINKDENYDQTLNNLTSAKVVIFDFFDNIIVNDEDKVIRKNRLELLKMLCKTFENYINFSKIESI